MPSLMPTLFGNVEIGHVWRVIQWREKDYIPNLSSTVQYFQDMLASCLADTPALSPDEVADRYLWLMTGLAPEKRRCCS